MVLILYYLLTNGAVLRQEPRSTIVPLSRDECSSASSDSGDARGDGKFVPIRPQVEDCARARMRWACPTTKN